MHSVSTKFENALSSMGYLPAWEIEIVPDYSATKQLKTRPQLENCYTMPNLLKSPSVAETIFFPNCPRNGNMYLNSNSWVSGAVARGTYISKSDGTFDQPLTCLIYFSTRSGLIDYRNAGFSTACRSGEHAVDFDVSFYKVNSNAPAKTVSITDYEQSEYVFGDVGVTDCYKIEVTIKKWNAAKCRAVITRVFIGAMPFKITNDLITSAPNVVKELESSSSNDVGALSSNQVSFEFFNEDDIDFELFPDGTLIKLKYGVKTEDFEEMINYGEYLIKSSDKTKKIVKITANDDLTDRTAETVSDFIVEDDDILLSYLVFADKLFLGISKSKLTADYLIALGDEKSRGNKTLRHVSLSNQANDFCTLTGTCIAYDDNGDLQLYPRFGGDVSMTVPDENVISHAITKRKVPGKITLNMTLGKLTQGGTVYEPKNTDLDLPPFSEVGTNLYPIAIDYNDSNTIAIGPTSTPGDGYDSLYATNAVLYRKLYDANGKEITNDYTVTAEEKYQYIAKGKKSKVFDGYNSTEYVLNTSLIPHITFDNLTDRTNKRVVEMSFLKNGIDWIYNWMNKTRYEHIFEIVADPRIELGDNLTILGITGKVYRIELNGSQQKITLRSDKYE